MDNMLLEKYASMLQKQASIKLQQEYGMEKQAFGLIGKGVNLLARGAGKGLKWGANAVQQGAKALQKGIGRAGNWAQQTGAAADKAIMGGLRTAGNAIGRGANAAWQGAKAVAKNPWVQGAAMAAVPGYGLYKGIQGVRGYMQEHDDMKRQLQEMQFQQPAQQASNPGAQLDQMPGTMGTPLAQQPAGPPPGLVSSFNYNPASQFGQYGM